MSNYEFYSWVVLGAIALVVLGAIFLIGRHGPKDHHYEDNYIHFN